MAAKAKTREPETKELRLRLYTPHDGQKVLHRSQARFRVATCGRRWGKTYACANEIAKWAWEHPNAMTWWVAPTYRQTMTAFRILTRNFRPAIESVSLTHLRLTWKSGSVTEFRSTENYDALRGEGLDFLVIDEAAMVPKEAWEAALRPTLSDKNGRAIIVSTPKGRNWFYHVWARGQDPEFPEWASFRFPTSANPYIPPDEIEEARMTLPADVFRQEYEAEFLEDSAGVFRGICDCIAGELDEPKPGRRYVVGWDVAKHQDFSVLVTMDVERGHVVAFDRFNQVDYALQLERVRTMCKKYNNARLLMDATGVGDPLLEQVKRMGIQAEGYSLTNTAKQQLIEHLAVKIERREITFPDIPVLVHELQTYQYEVTRAGNIRYSAPEGFHDDCVIALALAAWCLRAESGYSGLWEFYRSLKGDRNE
ncbi:terminase large subunit domain-containing protein [Alicyclobacillus vulcanalis]|uniref:Terminase-like family protein n=1 Tax=Alicyclobacillus vulcanalis TaxID=252246 RepID=A0A1N7MQX4_9BACL|nr:terminase family protein [Alicyclobacillus vulcanalis]SIS88535.1 Terminase-like family protein [Alicyclobacillus vulcanalis]